jgi:hypothetical protein
MRRAAATWPRRTARPIQIDVVAFTRSSRRPQRTAAGSRLHGSAAVRAVGRPFGDQARPQQQGEASPAGHDWQGPQQQQHGAAPPPGGVLAACAVADAPLPDALRAAWPATFQSASAARRVCRRRLVRVDGAPAGCGAAVRAGQLLEVLPPPGGGGGAAAPPRRRPRATPPPRGVDVGVLFDDDWLTVVSKPYGVESHGRAEGRHNLAAYVRALVPASAQGARRARG